MNLLTLDYRVHDSQKLNKMWRFSKRMLGLESRRHTSPAMYRRVAVDM